MKNVLFFNILMFIFSSHFKTEKGFLLQVTNSVICLKPIYVNMLVICWINLENNVKNIYIKVKDIKMRLSVSSLYNKN